MPLKKTLGLLTQTGYYLKKSWAKDASIPLLQRQWAEDTLQRFGFELTIIGTPADDTSLLLVGNHISYIDIAVLMYAVPQVSFVAKKQVSYWPVFGSAAKAMRTVFVDRASKTSRAGAREKIRESFDSGRRIVVFPSGTTRLDESIPWRKGAIEVAHQSGARVQPFRISYSPLRHTAYIDDDFFPMHLYNIARGPKIHVRLEFTDAQHVNDPHEDCKKWYEWAKTAF